MLLTQLEFLGYAPVPKAVGRIVSESRITDRVTAFAGGEWRIVIEHIVDSESKSCALDKARPARIVHFTRNRFLINGALPSFVQPPWNNRLQVFLQLLLTGWRNHRKTAGQV